MKLFQSHTHFDVYQNDAVTLVPSDYLPAEKALAKVPAVLFDVLENKHNQLVGHVDFRLGENQDLLTYAGHIGYDIFSQYRCRCGHKAHQITHFFSR